MPSRSLGSLHPPRKLSTRPSSRLADSPNANVLSSFVRREIPILRIIAVLFLVDGALNGLVVVFQVADRKRWVLPDFPSKWAARTICRTSSHTATSPRGKSRLVSDEQETNWCNGCRQDKEKSCRGNQPLSTSLVDWSLSEIVLYPWGAKKRDLVVVSILRVVCKKMSLL